MTNDHGVVVVIGGAGYVGSYISKEFSRHGFITVSTSRDILSHPDCVECDIANLVSLQTALDYVDRTVGKISCIVHSASPKIERVRPSRASSDSIREHTEVAIQGTENIVRESIARDIPNIVILTSQAAFSDPNSLSMGAYPAAKKAQEILACALSRSLKPHMTMHTIAPDFLPGGLNSDLPAAVQNAYAMRPGGILNSPQEIAAITASIVLDSNRYGESGSVDHRTGVLTPF